MAPKRHHPTEEIRRRLQRDRDALANTPQAARGPMDGLGTPDLTPPTLGGPKGARAVRKMAVPARRYWPSANSQRAPTRPQGSKKSPR